MKIPKLPLLIVTASVAAFSACERETPAERAGEQIEDATDEVGGTVEEAGDRIEAKTDD